MTRSFLGCLICILALGLSGCGPTDDKLLRAATNVWSGYELLYVARDLGLFDEQRIRLVELTSATDASQALRDGVVEAAALTLDEALTVREKGVPLRVVLAFDYSNGADALLAQPGIHALGDLKGKRIGVENSAVGAILLDAALTAAKLDARDIKTVYLTVDEQEAAYAKGEVDGVVTFDPVKSRLMGRNARVLFDSSQIPGRIMDVLAVREEALATHSDSLELLLRGYFQAFQRWRERPTQITTAMTPRLAMPAPSILESFRGLHLIDLAENRRILADPRPSLNDTAHQLASLMIERRLLSAHFHFDRLADARWLPAPPP